MNRLLGVRGRSWTLALALSGWYSTACGEDSSKSEPIADASAHTEEDRSGTDSAPRSSDVSELTRRPNTGDGESQTDAAASSESVSETPSETSTKPANTPASSGASSEPSPNPESSGPSGNGTSSGSAEPSTTGAVSSAEPPAPGLGTPGCGATPATGSLEPQALEIDGVQRHYIVSVPSSYDPERPYPLLFAFHGGGDSGQGFKGWSGVENVAEGIYIYPDGVNGIWAEEVYNNDFRLEHAAYEWAADHFCIDPNRVFAWGFSWGGWVTTQFACNSPDLLRGVIEIAGGGPLGQQCDTPVPMMLIHGSADDAEPITSSEKTRDLFTELNGCSPETSAYDPTPCLAHAGCEQPVVWCGHDGSHGIPDFAAQAITNFVTSFD